MTYPLDSQGSAHPPTPNIRNHRSDFLCTTIVLLAAITSFSLMLQHLGHPGLKGLDESFHAVVAESLLRHPLKPTLYDEPYLVRPIEDWQSSNVWLHKPTLPLWQIAVSYKLFGVTTFALRLPSAVLAALSVVLTYLTGRKLCGPLAATLPAIIQAFLPAIWMLVHGYAFSDSIDIAMLFYVQLGMHLLVRATQTQYNSNFILCGIAQGLAWLSKSHPAFIITGVATALWILPEFPRFKETTYRVTGRQLSLFMIATVITLAPWTLYTARAYPLEFAQSQLQVFHHLSENVEQFAAPWDRLLFNYWPQLTLYYYPVGLACLVVTARAAWQQRNPLLLVPLIWWIGFMIPHLFAITKTPSQTTPAIPALLLMIAVASRELLRRDTFTAVTLLIAALLATFWRPAIPTGGLGTPPDYTFAKLAIENSWVIIQPMIALAVGVTASLFVHRQRFGKSIVIVIAVCIAFNIYRAGRICTVVTRLHPPMPTYTDIGPFAQAHLPPNAVLLVEEQTKLERNTLMFYTGRNAYAVTADNDPELIKDVIDRGGKPYLVTSRAMSLPLLFYSPKDNHFLYALPDGESQALPR